MAKRHNTSTINETLRGLIKNYSNENRTFVTKSSPWNLSLLYNIGEFPQNLNIWHYMLFTCNYIVGQAIAIVKMNIYGQIHSIYDLKNKFQEDYCNVNAICKELNSIKNSNVASLIFLRGNGLPYIHFTYEQFL